MGSTANMPKLTLYRTNGSCSLVPHAILRHYNIPFDAIRLKPGPDGYEAADGSFTNAEYHAIHPRGYVPALTVDDETITEMPAILSYISSLIPNEKLLGVTAFQNAKVLEWLVFYQARCTVLDMVLGCDQCGSVMTLRLMKEFEPKERRS
ncbi:hypothetical protein ACLX1H_009235 [Fusarium chlamydosporum]